MRRRDTPLLRKNARLILSSRPVCALCGGEMIFAGDLDIERWWLHPKAATVNHKVPWIEGGSDDLSNLEPAHRGCNSALGNEQQRHSISRRVRDFGRPRIGTYDA